MTIRERVLASLRHQQPDKIPYNISFTQVARAKMVEYYGDPDFDGKLGNCFAGRYLVQGWREIAPDIKEDAWGVRWDRSVDKDIGNVCNCVVTPDNVDDFQVPDPASPDLWEPLPRLIEENPDRFIITDLGFSLFERAWTLAGMETILMGMMSDPDFVHRLLDRILEYNLKVIDIACSYKNDIMMFGDDWGTQRGVMMGADLWREFIGPRVKQMYQAAKAKGRFVFIHSCGKVDELFDELIGYGLDTFNPFQPEVMDPFEMKKIYGDRLCFFGGVSTQKLLPLGTPHETREQVKRLLDVVGKNGGYFASPAHATPADAKPENIAAMIDVLQNQ